MTAPGASTAAGGGAQAARMARRFSHLAEERTKSMPKLSAETQSALPPRQHSTSVPALDLPAGFLSSNDASENDVATAPPPSSTELPPSLPNDNTGGVAAATASSSIDADELEKDRSGATSARPQSEPVEEDIRPLSQRSAHLARLNRMLRRGDSESSGFSTPRRSEDEPPGGNTHQVRLTTTAGAADGGK